MLWFALATAIMMLTGEFYDDRAIAKLFKALRETIAVSVGDAPHRARALRAVDGFERAFEAHRRDLEEFTACVERADRKYRATQADYAACTDRAQSQRVVLRRTLDAVEREYEAALSPAEHALVTRSLTERPEARILDAQLTLEKAHSRTTRRSRGVEGVAAQRHLTVPRNVVSIIYGPLPASTFGQRFPSKIIDAGTSYARRDGGADGAAVAKEWHTRLGIRFGLFDDFEAGVLVPVRLAPDVALEPTLVALTQQFRFRSVDLAFRFSFQSPGDVGWALAPGAILKLRSQRLALHTGLLAPMEVGTLREHRSPTIGLNAPVRLIWNVLPSLYVTGESGVAYDNLDVSDGLTIPLGFGAGYTWLLGSRLLELTSSFTWDRWLLPSRPDDAAALQYKSYRVAFGAAFYFRAL